MAAHPGQKGQFVKGDPRCWRKGRLPSGLSLAEQVRAALAEDDKKGRPHLLNIIHKAIVQAEQGNDQARSFLMERGYGKAPLTVIMAPATQKYNLENMDQKKLDVLEDIVTELEQNAVIDGVAIDSNDTVSAGEA
jgi:hypothetical protein